MLSPVDRFLDRFRTCLTDGTFARLVLSGPVAPAASPEKVLGRLIDIQNTPHLSLTHRYPTRDETQNLPLAAAADWLQAELGRQFRNARLGTTRRDWQLVIPPRGPARLVGHAPAQTEPPPRTHDRPRQSPLGDDARDWLTALGIFTPQGLVRRAMGDKFLQIHRYVELLGHLGRDCGWDQESAQPVTLADMGCGKGYLTFGAWQLIRRGFGRPARVLGIETRGALVNAANNIARQIGADGLTFAAGTIATVALPPLDALVALHACNTATDDALRRGIDLGVRLIVVAPCCHQQVRPQLDAARRAPPPDLEPLLPVLRHGLMTDRLAEWATDGLRGLFLEWAGYRAKLFEFVPSEHTPKNLMIAAVRERPGFADPAARERIIRFKQFFGLGPHPLDPLLAAR